jgi:hypothetical protein
MNGDYGHISKSAWCSGDYRYNIREAGDNEKKPSDKLLPPALCKLLLP